MGAWSAQVNATVLTTATIGALQSLVASAGDGRVTLIWAAPTSDSGLGITGYHYRYGETGGAIGEWIAVGDVLTVTVPNLVNETGYDFEVRAFNSGGNGPASTASATPKDAPTAPSAPGSLRAVPSADSVTLTWSASAANGAPVTSYEYQYYETSGTAPQAWPSAGDVLSVTISNLTKGTSYTFNVRAVNSVGEGAVATVTSTPSSKPSAPQNLIATGGPGNITLSWDAPADDGGSAIVNYRIEKYNATSTNWGHLTTVSGTTEEYPDNNVTIGATTEYRVRAMNANTNDPSVWATVSGVAQGKGVPSAPANLKVTPGNERITYSWEAPASNGGSAITKYEYKHWQNDEAEPTEWTNASLSTSRTLLNLTATVQYAFRVRAVNDVGPGAAASLAGDDDATFASTSPDPPRRFEADADNRDAEIGLTWRDPDDDGGADVDGFELDFTTEEDPEESDWTAAPGYANDDDSEDSYDHEDLTNGVTYYYRVRALNARCTLDVEIVEDEDNCRQWAYANATTVSSYPARVGALAATTDDVTASFADGSITVSWEAPADHGQPITSYRLRWRHADDDGSAFPAANVVSVQAPATEYIMIGPEVHTGYVFQVLAVNSLTDFDDLDDTPAGNGDEPIKWSESSSPETVLPVSTQSTANNDTNALSASVASDGKATITWRMVEDTNYTIASYDLQWLVVDDTTVILVGGDEWDGDDVNSENLAAQALMSRITDPLPGAMDLFVRLRVVTNVGIKGAWVQVGPTDVDARAPDHPVLTATIIGQNVILSWEAPESNGAEITQYELQFKKDDGDFGDNDGDDDASDADDATDEDTTDNDVIVILAADTSHSHENLEADATYTYRIRTVTTINTVNYGNSDQAALATALAGRTWSAEVEAQSDSGPPADPVVPGTPVLTVMADNTDGDIELSWKKPSEGSESITSYHIMRWDGSDWEMLPTSLGAEDMKYDDTSAELGRMYYYAIRAGSSAGMGEYTQSNFPSAMLNAKTPAKIELSLDVDGQSITLTWDAPDANGAPISAYQIQVTDDPPADADGNPTENRDWGDGSTDDAVLNPSPALSASFTHSMRTPGKTYYYRIRAVNACNNTTTDETVCGGTDADNIPGEDESVPVASAEDWSDEESETADPVVPIQVGSEAGTADDLMAEGGDTQITLEWQLPGPDNVATDDDHEGTGGAPIDSVEIQRWNGSTAQWDTIKTLEVGLNENVTPVVYNDASETYTDTGLADGKTFTYRVRAVNSAGDGPWSDMVSADTDAARPDLPKLEATVSGQSVTLSWDTPDNNGSAIQRYEIQRFPSIGDDADDDGVIDAGEVENLWGDDSFDNGTDNDVIVPMPAGVTTHTDSGLSPSTLYYYRMRAVNSCNDTNTGDDECPGDTAVQVDGTTVAWSAVVQVTTDPRAPARIPRATNADDEDLNGLKLTGGENMVKLEWTDPEAYGSPISEYQIDRWNSVTRMWDPIKRELPASVRSYDDTGLETDTRYFYRVRAVNGGGEGAWSTLASAETDPVPDDE